MGISYTSCDKNKPFFSRTMFPTQTSINDVVRDPVRLGTTGVMCKSCMKMLCHY